jgi:hypothetical protein
MTNKHYILEDGKVVPVDLLTWAKWVEKSYNRIVKQETVGRYWVSTVFLGLDHNFDPTGAPILWETMAFVKRGSKMDMGGEYMDRCSGKIEQAEAMHQKMVERCRKEQEITIETH